MGDFCLKQQSPRWTGDNFLLPAGVNFPSNHCRWTHLHMPAADGHRWAFLLTFPSVGLVFRSHHPQWRMVLGTPWLPKGRIAELAEPTLCCCCRSVTSSACKNMFQSGFHQEQVIFPSLRKFRILQDYRCWLKQHLFLEAKLIGKSSKRWLGNPCYYRSSQRC